MIDFYFDSTIKIISIHIDENGKKTETMSSEISCKINAYNKIVVNQKGEEVVGEMKIRFSSDNVIHYGDYIRIISHQGDMVPIKNWMIKKIDPVYDFEKLWITVYI